jgi:hypothetical protein
MSRRPHVSYGLTLIEKFSDCAKWMVITVLTWPATGHCSEAAWICEDYRRSESRGRVQLLRTSINREQESSSRDNKSISYGEAVWKTNNVSVQWIVKSSCYRWECLCQCMWITIYFLTDVRKSKASRFLEGSIGYKMLYYVPGTTSCIRENNSVKSIRPSSSSSSSSDQTSIKLLNEQEFVLETLKHFSIYSVWYYESVVFCKLSII